MSTSWVAAINKRIREVNLEVGMVRFQRLVLEVGRVGEEEGG
jgi:hypothetical protein